MIVYRITKAIFKNDLSGKGAEKAGARWNAKGIALLYTAGNRALALAEMAVHLPFGILPKNYYLLSIFIPDRKDLILVSTFEPCMMCRGALIEYNIMRVYFLKGKGPWHWLKNDLKILRYEWMKEDAEGEALQDSLFMLHPLYRRQHAH